MTAMLWAALLLGFPVEEVPQVAGPVVKLEMEDQFQHPCSVAGQHGNILVLVYGDPGGEKLNNALLQRLHTHFHPTAAGLPPEKAQLAPVKPVFGATGPSPDVRVVLVACVGKVPNSVRLMLRSQAAKVSPVVAIWLDFEDALRQEFGLLPRTSNAVVFDTEGRLRMKMAGELDEAAFARLVQKIEYLRAEAVGVR